MSNRPSLDDYVDVAERIQDFKDAHPHGSLQTVDWGVKEVGTGLYVWYQAAAHRDQDDVCPGMGIAWEPFPGRTSFTKESELMNAETAAWGRAICALGLVSNRKLASRQEVRNRSEEQALDEEQPNNVTPIKPQVDAPAVKTITAAQVTRLETKLSEVDPNKIQLKLNEIGVSDLAELTTAQANQIAKLAA